MSRRLTFKVASEATNCVCAFCTLKFVVSRARPCLALGEKTICMKCSERFAVDYAKLLRESAQDPGRIELLDAAPMVKKSEPLLTGTDRMAAYSKAQREHQP